MHDFDLSNSSEFRANLLATIPPPVAPPPPQIRLHKPAATAAIGL
jgi:hypothetical protein